MFQIAISYTKSIILLLKSLIRFFNVAFYQISVFYGTQIRTLMLSLNNLTQSS